MNLGVDVLETIKGEIPNFELDKAILNQDLDILTLLSENTTIQSSKSEARRSIKNNAIAVNKIKVAADDHIVGADQLIHDKYMFLENGRRNKYILTFQ